MDGCAPRLRRRQRTLRRSPSRGPRRRRPKTTDHRRTRRQRRRRRPWYPPRQQRRTLGPRHARPKRRWRPARQASRRPPARRSCAAPARPPAPPPARPGRRAPPSPPRPPSPPAAEARRANLEPPEPAEAAADWCRAASPSSLRCRSPRQSTAAATRGPTAPGAAFNTVRTPKSTRQAEKPPRSPRRDLQRRHHDVGARDRRARDVFGTTKAIGARRHRNAVLAARVDLNQRRASRALRRAHPARIHALRAQAALRRRGRRGPPWSPRRPDGRRDGLIGALA